jgi:hypothetical protein
MPFTISHVAAVLPLRRFCRRDGQMSALAIGAMMPDLPYYLTPLAWGLRTHSWHSLLWWSIPMGALVWWWWHRNGKHACASALSARTRSTLAQRGAYCAPEIGLAHAGGLCAVGACTHLVLDLFTHNNTVVVYALPWLRTQVWGWSIVFHLQVCSSVLGLIIVAAVLAKRLGLQWWCAQDWWCALHPDLREWAHTSRKRVWIAFIVLTVALGVLSTFLHWRALVFLGLTTLGCGVLILLVWRSVSYAQR